jgi:hypothetical protein
LPLASLLHDRFIELFAKEGEDRDWSEIGKLARRDNGETPVDACVVEREPALA